MKRKFNWSKANDIFGTIGGIITIVGFAIEVGAFIYERHEEKKKLAAKHPEEIETESDE